MARQSSAREDRDGDTGTPRRRLNPSGPVPLYHQIFLIVRNRIYAGELSAGDQGSG